jgi:hypothetical protein
MFSFCSNADLESIAVIATSGTRISPDERSQIETNIYGELVEADPGAFDPIASRARLFT